MDFSQKSIMLRKYLLYYELLNILSGVRLKCVCFQNGQEELEEEKIMSLNEVTL